MQDAKTEWPQTLAETSDWTATCSSSDVVDFVGQCAAQADHVNDFQFGTTLEGRPMIGVTIANPEAAYQLGQQDGRSVVLVIGNIHSGECCGKEALLMMLRELSKNPNHRWLKKSVLVFVPNYSADSNERVGLRNRPGQIGPERGMGRRENPQGLDLNRDFMKIESPEARAMVKLIDQVNPHVFVDCHTTNGSIHQYALTYDIPHNPSAPAPIRNFLRQKMMPEVTEQLEKNAGLYSFYYGNFNRAKTAWTTYGHEPRYSTEYVGLRGRLAILSEAYAYLSYRERILATEKFVSTILDYVAENSDSIVKLLESVDQEQIQTASQNPERVVMSLQARVKKFPEKVAIKGYVDDRAETKQPKDYVCDFVGDYEPTTSRPLPYAYVLPKEQVRIVDRMMRHGIEVKRLAAGADLQVEVDRVQTLARSPRAFQKHNMLRVSAVSEGEQRRRFEVGSYIVWTAQPLGRLASYLLESESNDGFAFWNFLDEFLEEGGEYPVFRLNQKQDLATEPIEKLAYRRPLTLEMIDGEHRLLLNHPKPVGFHGKTNQVASKSWGRTLFVDAESMSFVEQPATDRRALRAAFEQTELEPAVVRQLLQGDVQYSDKKNSVVYSAEGYAAAYSENMGVKVIGSPGNEAELVDWNSDESVLIFHRGGDLVFLELGSGKERLIAAASAEELVGKLDWVYQEELYGRGNFKGYWPSPVGNLVAYLRLDEAPVARYTITDHIPVRGEFEVTRYPKAGDALPAIGVEIADSKTGESTKILLGDYDGDELLVSRVTWDDRGDRLFVQVQNREQTWLDLIAVSPVGSATRIFRDKTPAWIESPGDPVFLPDGSFVWMSPRSGYRHLYHYAADGKLIKQLTRGEWEVREVLGADADREHVYFMAAKEKPTQMHLYRFGLWTGKLDCLLEEAGTHDVNFSDDFRYFIDVHSSWNRPSTSKLYRADGTFLRELDASTDDRLDFVELVAPELVEVPTGNGQPMDGMLIKPADFDPGKKYPVLVHVYGGPQTPRVRNRFGGEWYLWHQYLAQQGFVVWVCDGQSSSYRSVKNAWPIHQNLAEKELADIEQGLDWLIGKGWVDESRIGIWGWSYGGYMTAYAMTHSDRFACGISGAPVTDWRNYDAIYTERYMGLPTENAAGYEKTSVLPAVKKLSGKILLIHGTIDDNVHLGNTLQLVHELQRAGKRFGLMVYPKNRHAIRKDFQKRHLRQLMTDYIFLHLRSNDRGEEAGKVGFESSSESD